MNLKKAMTEKKVTQRELAAACGVTQAAVSWWVCEKFLPQARQVPIIEKTLGVQCRWDAFAKGKLRFRRAA